MHIVYYCLGISVVNGWLLYRRHSEQKHIDKNNVISLLKFQSQVANALIRSGKAQTKCGRPLSSSPVVERPQKHHSAAAAVPCNDIKKTKLNTSLLKSNSAADSAQKDLQKSNAVNAT